MELLVSTRNGSSAACEGLEEAVGAGDGVLLVDQHAVHVHEEAGQGAGFVALHVSIVPATAGLML